MKNKILTTGILFLTAMVTILSACSAAAGGGGEDTPGSFNYNNHSYKIIKSPKNWFDAKTAAIAAGGYLVHIESADEDAKIYSELVKYIKNSEFANTVANDGGNASYVWIGANDIKTEGDWKWTDNKLRFWTGNKNGQAVSGRYNNWGKKNGRQNEPDNWKNMQDAAGIALTQWPKSSGSLGSKSQWNDIDINNKLFYVIEFDQIRK